MKKQKYLLGAAMAMALAGCSDDLTEKITNPVQTGEEIIFGSSISKENQTDAKGIQVKTIYGNRTETGIPVYWNPKGDTIAIFCPQASAPANKLVNYVVMPDTTKESKDWSTSATVEKEKLNEAGLQWGSENEHEFYALYPAKGLKKAENLGDDAVKHGVLTATIPVTQNPTLWEPLSMGTGLTYFSLPNMDYAYMWAHNHVMKDQLQTGSPINLHFNNLVTVLDITIPGPVEGGPVTLTNINIESLTPGDVLTGDFKFYIQEKNADGRYQGYVEPVKSDEVRNVISISCWNKEENKFITLKPGTYAVVKAYLVPAAKDLIQKRKLKISVAKLNGGAPHKKTFDAEIVAQKVNRIVLPEVYNTTTPDNWMNSLDPNIYLSELSVPGSKFSYLTIDNKANPPYQTKTIQGQFDDGIRAFIVQTGSQTTYEESRKRIGGSDWFPRYEYSYKHKNTEMPVTGAIAGTTLENTVKDITAGLEKAPNECAFIVLTCNSSDVQKHKYVTDGTYNRVGGKGVSTAGWTQSWIEAVKFYLQQLVDKGYPIYTEEITANTTIGDVRGKIIFKVNYNDHSQEQYITANDRVPALFSMWINPKTIESLTPTAPLRWGTPNPESSRTPMNWMHVEATNVGSGAELEVEQKKKAITNMFQNAVDIYLKGDSHNTFFMTDIGGVYTADNSTIKLAKDMNKLAVDALQTRTQNASTGLIFMNFADRGAKSGQECQSDWIISTIIDNNFKFALRKRPTSN